MAPTVTTPGQLGRVLRYVGVAMILEATMFSVLTPLLPHYVSDLGFTETEVGVLSAMVGAGLVVGAVPAGILASRTSGKSTVILGFGLLAVATLGFGFGDSFLPLSTARFFQGLGAGCIWSGALTWVARLAEGNPATALGTLIGTAVAGTLLGPAVGALAVAASSELVFSCFAVVMVAFAFAIGRLPRDLAKLTPSRDTGLSGEMLRQVAAAVWLMALPSAAYGFLLVLSPLRLDVLGVGSAAIAVTFIVAGVMEAGVPPIAGRLADRRGVTFVLSLAAGLATATFVGLAIAGSAVVFALMTVASIGALGVFWAPSSVRIHDAMVGAGAREAKAFGVVTLCFAGGQMVGALSSGALAESIDVHATFAIIAAVFALTLISARLVAAVKSSEKVA